MGAAGDTEEMYVTVVAVAVSAASEAAVAAATAAAAVVAAAVVAVVVILVAVSELLLQLRTTDGPQQTITGTEPEEVCCEHI